MKARALITGGSSGLGRSLARQLAAEGMTIVSVDRTTPDVNSDVIHIACDLAHRNMVDTAIAAILAAGPYDFVFLNAGGNATGPFETLPHGALRRLMILNAETPMVLASTLVRHEAIKGSICLISSLSHYTGYPGGAVYAASKDALAAYARGVRKPFARRGVSVTLACPGPIRTEHAARHAPRGAKDYQRMDPDAAAAVIIAATRAGRRLVVPGWKAKLFALAGSVAPGMTTRYMRRLIYDRLEHSEW